jgi:HD domain
MVVFPHWRRSVKSITALAANKLGKFLAEDFRRVFGPAHHDMAERLGAFARSTIECLARSDALYHNYEHTLQVTMVGREILQGMTLSQRIEPTDYSHLIIACLLHDIGYMRGVLSGDTETEFVVDGSDKRITLPRGASDAALAPYHVDRSKIFAFERLGKSPDIDASRVAAAIEMTRFPPPLDRAGPNKSMEPKLVQAADLIGQLGDPMYSRKANALYSEFEEISMNRQLGYSSPADIIDKYPTFFWDSISTHIEDGMKYLNMTDSGRQWIANLHHHILCAEHAHRFMGPQR